MPDFVRMVMLFSVLLVFNTSRFCIIMYGYDYYLSRC